MSKLITGVWGCCGLLLLAGCGGPAGPELGKVTGVVTLNGVAVDQLDIAFEPKEGRPSTGVTGLDGSYTLHYSPEEEGAIVGDHKVRITYANAAEREIDIPIPPRFNDESTLTAAVKAGENNIDFNLEFK